MTLTYNCNSSNMHTIRNNTINNRRRSTIEAPVDMQRTTFLKIYNNTKKFLPKQRQARLRFSVPFQQMAYQRKTPAQNHRQKICHVSHNPTVTWFNSTKSLGVPFFWWLLLINEFRIYSSVVDIILCDVL